MSRTFVYELLTTDTALNDLGYTTNNVYGSQSLDTPQTPFMVQRWGETPAAWGATLGFSGQSTRVLPSRMQELAIWVYDTPGTYSRIDATIKRIRALFHTVVAAPTDDGWITQIDWAGDGNDLEDDVYAAIMRTTSYHVISSGR